MPLSASRYVDIDCCLPLADIAPTLVRQPRSSGNTLQKDKAVQIENLAALNGRSDEKEMDAIGARSTQTCPDCGGTIWAIHDSKPLRFRCHTGHAHTAQSMLQAQDAFSEQALWAAMRALHERHTCKRLAAADVAPARLRRYFTGEGQHYRVSDKVRQTILFSMHNILRDPPFSRLHPVSCWNLLTYPERDVQKKVLDGLHYALQPGGYLFLGSAETAETAGGLLAPVDKKHRIYRATPVRISSYPQIPQPTLATAE